MAFYLVLSLGATAGLFFLAGADFVGAMQFMIYVGGTLVLLVFGVMLTSQDRFVSMKTNNFELWMAAGVGLCLFVLLVYAARSVPDGAASPSNKPTPSPLQTTATPLGMGLLGRRVDAPDRSGYLLVFEIVSVHLLVVLIGAAYLAQARRRRTLAVE